MTYEKLATEADILSKKADKTGDWRDHEAAHGAHSLANRAAPREGRSGARHAAAMERHQAAAIAAQSKSTGAAPTKARKLAAFAGAAKETAPKMLQRGKKGGVYYVSESGRKVYR